MTGGIKALLSNERAAFVIVNVVVNLVFLVRSYVTMRVLGYSDLGLTALLQTLILLISALQFGVINGGYRLLCSESPAGAVRINNLTYTFIGALTLVLLAAAALLQALAPAAPTVTAVGYLGICAGVLTLIRNWMTNQLIAVVRLRQLNNINIVSALVSMAPLLLVRPYPLAACLAAIVLQPLAFAVHVLVAEPGLRPTAWSFHMPLFRQVMAAGFVVFLTGIFLTANAQIERWSIVSCIGVAGLGRYYLALLFLNLYNLVPTALGAVFLPKLVQTHARGDYHATQAELRTFLRVTLYYSVAVLVCVWPLAALILGLLLPKYLADLPYVYLLAPGVLVFGLSNPFAIVFNVLIRYRYYFYSYGFGTLATALLIGGYILATGTIDLATVSIIKSIVFIIMAVIIVVGYQALAREYPEFRFLQWQPRKATSA